MAYDAATREIVLFGGSGSDGELGDTWIWDGSTWAPVCGTHESGATAPCGPDARSGASFAYDATAGDLVLFGGCCTNTGSGPGPLADWLWGGQSWAQSASGGPAQSPPAEAGASMAQNGDQGVVLFDSDGSTWTWAENAWTEQAAPGDTASPLVIFGAGMAFDATRHIDLLFGGFSGVGFSPLSDTWAWNGRTWTLAGPASSDDAFAVVRRYIKALNDHSFATAYALLGNAPQAQQPMASWQAGYADTSSIRLYPGAVTPNPAGYVIQTTYVVTHTDDTLHYYAGSYVVGLEDGALKILSGQFKETPTCPTDVCNGPPVSQQ